MEIRIDTNPGAFDALSEVLDALKVTAEEWRGPVLDLLGKEHRRQELRIFGSEGAQGIASWPPLHPEYAAFKEEVLGSRPILVWSGEMRAKFVNQASPEYVQGVESAGDAGASFFFGAASDIAAKHREGAFTEIQPRTLTSKKTGKKVTWPKMVLRVQLPVRDMVSKSAQQLDWLMSVFDDWYRQVKLPAIKAAFARAREKGNQGLLKGFTR